jgi:hypothetical protein
LRSMFRCTIALSKGRTDNWASLQNTSGDVRLCGEHPHLMFEFLLCPSTPTPLPLTLLLPIFVGQSLSGATGRKSEMKSLNCLKW